MATKSRGRPYGGAITAVQRAATKLHSFVYRATSGRLGGSLAGGPVLLLTTTGRKSGEERTVPLLYIRDGESFVIVGSNGGTAAHPAWWLNLKSNPLAKLEVGRRRLRARAEEAEPEEQKRLWPRLVEMYGGYESYRRRTDSDIPVVLLHPTEDEG
ncbi:MAG TPA: nitroreductase family deazaflavin-dependent oxidoreductase [Rubrobacteraceae bacterium]|nr:nitroreductase family deazaflavin-dependent oxidoreductase [Rubrobacteraceae bacterium]